MNRYLLIICLLIVFSSCRKDGTLEDPNEIDDLEENTCSVNFGGDYECELHSLKIVQGSTYSDTTFFDTLTIVHETDLIEVDSWEFPQDSICSEQVYGESLPGPTWFDIQFYADSIYYQNRFGSVGSYTINTRYGRKI